MRPRAFGTPPFKGCDDPECAPCAAVRVAEDLQETLEDLSLQVHSSWRATDSLRRSLLAAAIGLWGLSGVILALLGRSWGWW